MDGWNCGILTRFLLGPGNFSRCFFGVCWKNHPNISHIRMTLKSPVFSGPPKHSPVPVSKTSWAQSQCNGVLGFLIPSTSPKKCLSIHKLWGFFCSVCLSIFLFDLGEFSRWNHTTRFFPTAKKSWSKGEVAGIFHTKQKNHHVW